MDTCEIRETPSESEDDEAVPPRDLSSPNPCILKPEILKKEVIEFNSSNNQFLISISNISDKYLSIELIPADGSLPYSYKVNYTMQILTSIEYIFKDLKTINECIDRIVSLILKKRILLYRDSEKNLFYVVFKITIIDEDKYIPFKLTCTNSIQSCTVKYIFNEIDDLKEKYETYKKDKIEQIEKYKKEINELKNKNNKYLKIIKKLKYESDDEYKNKIKNLKFRLTNLEQKLIEKKLKFKIEIIPYHKIIIRDKKNANKEFNIQFNIKNIGNTFISSKYDKIFFEKDKNFSSNEIDLVDINDYNIILKELFKPNEIKEFNLKLKINNPINEQTYNFHANIKSNKHGILSTKPLIIQVLIVSEKFKENNLSKYLQNNYEINIDYENYIIIEEEDSL
jgi:hypothetical protein